MTALTRLCLVSLVTLFATQAANAQEFIRFCVTIPTSYEDVGNGEDYFTNNHADRAIGAYMSVVSNDGNLRWQGYANDGIDNKADRGCTPTIQLGNSRPMGNWTIQVKSEGRVQGNYISVVRRERPDRGDVFRNTIPIDYGSNTYVVRVGVQEFAMANVYQAAAWALYRHAGGMTDKNYRFVVGDAPCVPGPAPVGPGCFVGGDTKPCPNDWGCYQESTGRIWIGSEAAKRKFQIVNNLGRRVGDLGTHGKLANADCSYSSNTCPNAAPVGVFHSMGSREAAACAVQEGFAHFYSADVWNNHDEQDCRYKYFVDEFGNDDTPLINCEGGEGVFPAPFMETECGVPWDGRAVELDWFRLFWDLHTSENAAQPTKPTFTAILRWLDSAQAWGAENAFNCLDAAINNHGIGENLRVRWNSLKVENGVDHPNL